jgi:hypothetical protein
MLDDVPSLQSEKQKSEKTNLPPPTLSQLFQQQERFLEIFQGRAYDSKRRQILLKILKT